MKLISFLQIIFVLFACSKICFKCSKNYKHEKTNFSILRTLSKNKEDSNSSCFGGICRIFSSDDSSAEINPDDYENSVKTYYEYHNIDTAPIYDKTEKKLNCGKIQACIQLALQKVFPKTLAQIKATYDNGKPAGQDEDEWAVIKYTDQTIFDAINWHLKSNFDKFLKDASKIQFLKDVTNSIDTFIGTKTVAGKVYRGTKISVELKKNQVYLVSAYTSTSPTLETPLKYKGAGLIMEIEGTAKVPLIGVKVADISIFKTEKEILLGRNQYLKYIGKGTVNYNNKDEEVYKFVSVSEKSFSKKKNILK